MLQKIINHDIYDLPTGWDLYGESASSFCKTLASSTRFNIKRLLTFFCILSGEREKVQTVCVGKEFRLHVDSTSRIVTFTPDDGGPRQVLLEKTTVSGSVFVLHMYLRCFFRIMCTFKVQVQNLDFSI